LKSVPDYRRLLTGQLPGPSDGNSTAETSTITIRSRKCWILIPWLDSWWMVQQISLLIPYLEHCLQGSMLNKGILYSFFY
jgi:hypothetical protein